jgi:RNA polymerase sigma-70 factor (ECF subfamily)
MSPPPVSPEPAVLSAPSCATPEADPTRWFKQEVHPHDGQLKSWLRGQFPAIRDVDDVVQESYLRIWKAKMTQPIASAKAYLYTTARHLALNIIRRERRSPVTFDGGDAASRVIEDKASVADVLTEQEKIELLTDALAALPARARALLLLHKFEGLTHAEIARRTGFTIKAVEHQVARGVRLCTDYFHARGHDFF